MEITATALIGYLLGSLSPAALLSKIKQHDLRNEGTKNLGASNTMLVMGKGLGALVMVLDIFKGFLAVKLAKLLFPQLAIAGILACIGAILGHCFPVFLHFQGGKGLAAFGGMVLAYNPLFFPQILIPGILLMLITDSGAVMPVLASCMFPVLVWMHRGSLMETVLAVLAGLLLLFVHRNNLRDARKKEDGIFVREFFRKVFHKE